MKEKNLIVEELKGIKEYQLEIEDGIVLLNKKNVIKVETMISTDSKYRNSMYTINPPKIKKLKELGKLRKNYDFKKIGTSVELLKDLKEYVGYDKDINNYFRYIGSSTYWLEELNYYIDNYKEKDLDKELFGDILKFVICSIDNENSTHLNSDRQGRNNVCINLLNLYKDNNYGKLKDDLKNSEKTEYKLIKIIGNAGKETKTVSKKYFSFATKFCHYACMTFFKGTSEADNFSIIDNVLLNNLPKYIKYYLHGDININDLKKYKEQNYKEYIKIIDLIRDEAEKKYGERISRNGLDHLIWYYHKGKN